MTGDLAWPYIVLMAALSLPWESIPMSAQDLNTRSHALAGSEEISQALQDVFNFKEYTDNPADIPIGTPIALVFIAAALLFLPSILDGAGNTTFGSNGGTTEGPQSDPYISPNDGSLWSPVKPEEYFVVSRVPGELSLLDFG